MPRGKGKTGVRVPAPDLPDLPGALCAGHPDLFFDPDRTDEARRVCRRCPAREPCLAYATANPDLRGTWGGQSEAQRARKRKAA